MQQEIKIKVNFKKNRCAYCKEMRAQNDFHFRLRAYG